MTKTTKHIHDYEFHAEPTAGLPGVWICKRCANQVPGTLLGMPCMICSTPVRVRGPEFVDYAYCGPCTLEFLGMEPKPESVSGSTTPINGPKKSNTRRPSPRKLPPGVRAA